MSADITQAVSVTAGPLAIQPNDRGDGIWLKDPARMHWPSVATVWRAAHGQVADGNAVVMAHAAPLFGLAIRVAAIQGKQSGREVIADAKRLLAEMQALAEATGAD